MFSPASVSDKPDTCRMLRMKQVRFANSATPDESNEDWQLLSSRWVGIPQVDLAYSMFYTVVCTCVFDVQSGVHM